MSTISTPLTFAIDAATLANDLTFTISDIKECKTTKFYHIAFWNHFFSVHKPNSPIELLDLLVDISRCIFSPKSSNWPGAKIKVGYTDSAGAKTHDITLTPGVTKIVAFKKGDRGIWNWTNICLASAGLFYQIWSKSTAARTIVANIPGCVNGVTPNMATLNGYEMANYNDCVTAFNTFVTTNGLNQRDAAVTAKIQLAVEGTIRHRKVNLPALGLKNVMRLSTGVNVSGLVDADNPTML